MTAASANKVTVPGDQSSGPSSSSATRRPFWHKIPIIKELRVAVGWQKGMLITGLVLTAFFLLVAIFAPLIAPYSYAQLKGADGVSFPAQAAPSSEHIWGTTAGGYDVFSRVVWGARHRRHRHRRRGIAVDFRRRAARPGLRLFRRMGRSCARHDRRRRVLLPVAAAGDSDGDHDLPRPVRPVERHLRLRHLHHRGLYSAILPYHPCRSDPHQGIRVRGIRPAWSAPPRGAS